jgi:protein-L-isoaspartate(D-aspartate) O-methyltransferase
VAIDAARCLNNGQPSALARWIDAFDLCTGDRVLHVGCGVGYYTPILPDGRDVERGRDPFPRR